LATGLITHSGGHWCYWEKADEFNDLVMDFLDDQYLEAR
jgi:pimeloyl-ACP methyl ester carboxylesterase